MNDFQDLLESASRPDQDWLADSRALLAEGRRRVRRRRLRAGAVGCVVALTVTAAGVTAGRWHTGPDRPVTATPTSYADLDLTPLTNAQVEARCAAQLRTVDGLDSFTIEDTSVNPPGTGNVQPPHPWHVGTQVFAEPTTAHDKAHIGNAACTVPESPAAPSPLTVTSDAAQVQQICSDNLRVDLSGWQPLAADADGGAEVGIYRSGNGYLADCHAQDNTLVGVQGNGEIEKAGDWFGYGVCSPVAPHDIHCFGIGRIADHTATQVAVTLPSGRVVDRPAVDGYWAVAVRDDASGASTGSGNPLKAEPLP
jgi:hypothetical protein